MPPSITLAGLSYRIHDAEPLFNGVDIVFGPERTGLVGRNGVGKSTLLKLMAGQLTPSSGRVVAKGRIAIVSQDAVVRTGDHLVDLFGARAALALLARAEAGHGDSDCLAEADWTLPARMASALARVRLDRPLDTPLASLSGGERMRAALAGLLFAAPDILLLDEPTNSLDHDGRQAVLDLLADWRGGLVLVSHDRALLERMDSIVELTRHGLDRYGGNYSHFAERRRAEDAALQQQRASQERQAVLAARRAQEAVERQARRNGNARRNRAKGGQPKILLDIAKERAEGSQGADARLRAARRKAAAAELRLTRARIDHAQELCFGMAPSQLADGRSVLRLERVCAGYAAQPPVIRNLSLHIAGPERVAVMGPNGCGKSTLLKVMSGRLAPLQGNVHIDVPHACLDQDLTLVDRGSTLRDNVLRLVPEADENAAHAALARFGFRSADALRPAAGLSGGQMLRAALACVMGARTPPQLLILDEPTNHLDLDALEALEAALTTYDGALVVTSHDATFLQRMAPDRWLDLASCGR